MIDDFKFLEKNIPITSKIIVLRKPTNDELPLFHEMLKQNNIKILYQFESVYQTQNIDMIADAKLFQYPINFDNICREIHEFKIQREQQNKGSCNLAFIYAFQQNQDGQQPLHYCLSTLIAYLYMHYQTNLEQIFSQTKIENTDQEQITQIMKEFIEKIKTKQENGEFIIQSSPSELLNTNFLPIQSQIQLSYLNCDLIQSIQRARNQNSQFSENFIESKVLNQHPYSDGTPTAGNLSRENIDFNEPPIQPSKLLTPPQEQPAQRLPNYQNYKLPKCLAFKSFKPNQGFSCLQKV